MLWGRCLSRSHRVDEGVALKGAHIVEVDAREALDVRLCVDGKEGEV